MDSRECRISLDEIGFKTRMFIVWVSEFTECNAYFKILLELDIEDLDSIEKHVTTG